MKEKVNTYFAVLLITIFGALAAFAIVDIATTDVIAAATSGSTQTYEALRESILNNRL